MRSQNSLRFRLAFVTTLLAGTLTACQTPKAITRPGLPQARLETTEQNFLPAPPAWQPAPREQRFAARQLSQIRDHRAPEISGIAASSRQGNLLWAITDSGNSPDLLAFSRSGEYLASWPTVLRNRDWEDLASFVHAGRPYLLVAETGDNRRVHPSYELHIFAEPDVDIDANGNQHTTTTAPLEPVATLRFVYPDGPKNSEAVAVSQADNAIIIVTKESDSAGIYQLPLSLDPPPGIVTATRLSTFPALPQSPGDGLIAKLTGIDFAVATALDINPQGNAAVMLTYREVYRWTRQSAGQSWGEVLAGQPQKLLRHELHQAEALGFDIAGNAIYLTSERLPAPVLLLEPARVSASQVGRQP